MLVARLKQDLGQLRSALIAVPVSASALEDSGKVQWPLGEIDSLLGGSLFNELQARGFKAEGKEAQLFTRLTPGGEEEAQRIAILAIPIGEAEHAYDRVMLYRRIGASAAAHAKAQKLADVIVLAHDLDLTNNTNASALVEAVILSEYDFTECLSQAPEAFEIEHLKFAGMDDDVHPEVVRNAEAVADGIMLSRTLTLLPPDRKSPVLYVERVRRLLDSISPNLDVVEVTEAELIEMKAGGILGVNRGSTCEARLLKLVYNPGGPQEGPPIGIVGKGVIFDTGGNSLKPPAAQPDMKGDCGGANSVVGAMLAIAKMRLGVAVTAYVPLVENRINGSAIVPSDVLTSLSGKTVEVMNTDAEGRLILMDALTMAQRDGCTTVVDLATLTGACMVALGMNCSGVFSNDDALAEELLQAAAVSGDRLWRLPLLPEYDEDLKSGVADFSNMGGVPWGGAIHAGLFLQRFIEEGTRWAHLDIAGPGTNNIRNRAKFRGGPVGAIARFVQNLHS